MESVLASHVRMTSAWCADCGVPDPQWASKAFGVTLCLQCAGAHRGLGPASKVASLTLDDWSPEEEAAFAAKGGNAAVNKTVAATTPAFALNASTPAAVRNSFCSAKWMGRPFDLGASLQASKHSIEQVTVNSGILRIELLHGRNLKAADLSGKSDPYVVFGIGRFGDKKLRLSQAQSSVARQTLNPDWNETFMLNVPSQHDALTMQVYDYDPPPKKHDYLGQAVVELAALQDGVPLEVAPPLSKKGYVRVRLTFTKL